MSNIKMLIQGHNKKTLNNKEKLKILTQKSHSATAETKPMSTQKQIPDQERNL